MIHGLDLFSGYGGLTLALSEWVRPVAYCENEKYCQAILISRMERGEIPIAPICDDVREMSGRDFPEGYIDIIYGGFPCQDLSVAGSGAGLAGERSGLFYEIVRLSKEIRPTFIFLENVIGIRKRGLHTVGRELANIGYDCRWGVVSAENVGAPHQRKRWFLLAYSKCNRGRAMSTTSTSTEKTSEELQPKDRSSCADDSKKICRVLANTLCDGSHTAQKRQSTSEKSSHCEKGQNNSTVTKRRQETMGKRESHRYLTRGSWWETEPNVGRVANGTPFRVDRIKALGNGVVPIQAKVAFETLIGYRRHDENRATIQ